jgi:hypothetical protein
VVRVLTARSKGGKAGELLAHFSIALSRTPMINTRITMARRKTLIVLRSRHSGAGNTALPHVHLEQS